MPTIFRKSAKGVTEIETRAHRLVPRLRCMLILVDGKRSDAELAALMPQLGVESLQALVDEGFVEALAAAEPAPTAVASAVAASAPVAFNVRRVAAVRAVNEALGPAAQTLAIRMERARTAEELRPLLASAAQAIGSQLGKAAADGFAARFADL